MQPERDYPVGYKKPPKETQFKKRQSGNPKGRPRREKTVENLLDQILNEKVAVTENGRHRKISKRQAIFKHLANRAAQGDTKTLLDMVRLMETSHKYHEKLGTNVSPLPRVPSAICVLPHNDRDDLDMVQNPELTRRLETTEREWYLEQERKQNPANDNDDGVPQLEQA